MESKKILFGQTLIDIAVQELGDASRAFEIAVMNGINITDDLTPGLSVLIPVADNKVRNIVQLFTDKANAPASADIAGEMKTKNEGVDYWKIEKDFIIQ